jgi:hypothetical protein
LRGIVALPSDIALTVAHVGLVLSLDLLPLLHLGIIVIETLVCVLNDEGVHH